MTQLYTITWHSPHGKHLTSRPCSEAQARFEIEHYARCTPDWTYTIEPPLPDWQTQLDAAQARIAELEAVCREVIALLGIDYADLTKTGVYVMNDLAGYHAQNDTYPEFGILSRMLDILPPAE